MGSRSSRIGLHGAEPLSKEAIEELCQDTGFSEDELLKWHKSFYKDCPDGRLTLKQFEQEYSRIMGKPTQKTSDYIKHMFNVYDQDKNQIIDFREFVMALSAASVVNCLRLVETIFSIFDLDNDGKITKAEISKMLHTLVEVTSANKKHYFNFSNEQNLKNRANLQKRIDDAFNELNLNHDDHITKDEFIEWYMKSGLLSEVKPKDINARNQPCFQQMDRRSRKPKRHKFHLRKGKDEIRHRSQFIYMTHMTEQKLSTNIDSNDHYVSDDESIAHKRMNLDDIDLQQSKISDRWQDLFNSVLEQVHSKRFPEEQHRNLNGPHRIEPSISRQSQQQQDKKIFKLQSTKQNSNDSSSSNDIISVRL